MAWQRKTNLRGPRGHGVASSVIDERGHLLLELTDKGMEDAGQVRGPQGIPGSNGLPTDEAFAALVQVPSKSRAELERRYRRGVSVVEYGAVGDGVADDAAAFNAALAGGNHEVFVPAGRYRLTAHVRVYANTTVTMDPDAVILNDNQSDNETFINGLYGSPGFASGYSGPGNICFRGGTIDLGMRRDAGYTTEALAFSHAEHIRVEGVRFINGAGNSHYIEFNACRGVVVRGCTFDGWDPRGNQNREAINIDHSYPGGYPQHGAWDDTPCDDVLIEGNTFRNGQVAVGTHAGTGPLTLHTSIRVVNNEMTNLSQQAIRARFWGAGSIIQGNRITNAGKNAATIEYSQNVLFQGNAIFGAAQAGENDSAVYVNQTTGARLLGNRVSNEGWPYQYTDAVVVSAASNMCEVDTLGLSRGSSKVINQGSAVTIVDGVWSCNIADDQVAMLPFPGTDLQGVLIVSTHSTQSHSARGLYWGRAQDGLLALDAIATIPAADVVLTTGPLTGTTGADGKITLSVGGGFLYLENRAGFVRRIDVKFVAS